MTEQTDPFAVKTQRRVSFTEEALTNKGGSKTFEPLVAGEYYFEVVEHAPKEDSDIIDQIKLSEVETNSWVFDNLVYQENALWKIAQILVSAGVIEEATPGMQIDVPDLTGKKLRARVYVNTKGPTPRNRVSEYLPPIK